MQEQIVSVAALIEDAFICLLGDAWLALQSSPNRKVIHVMQTVVSRALAKGFWSADFYTSVQEARHKFVTEPLTVDTLAAKLVIAPSFTVPVANFVKHEVKKKSPISPRCKNDL